MPSRERMSGMDRACFQLVAELPDRPVKFIVSRNDNSGGKRRIFTTRASHTARFAVDRERLGRSSSHLPRLRTASGSTNAGTYKFTSKFHFGILETFGTLEKGELAMTFKLFSINCQPRTLAGAFILLLVASFTPGAQGQSYIAAPTRNPNCPPLQGEFADIFDFAPQEQNGGAASNLAIDRAGNLYGALAIGGNHTQGLLYKLSQRGSGWLLDPLYNFLGGDNGGNLGNVVLGPDGALYGEASTGGIQACGNNGSSYCGEVYRSTPGPTACATALCGWNEATLYQFNGNTDAWGGTVSAFDHAGNLYGISLSGGAYGQGAVFELTPSQGGWTEQVIYSFTGGSDGAHPSSLLVGHDGNLYGTALAGGINFGVIFQLVSSGDSWSENVLYTFQHLYTAYEPGGLIQDNSGNLYGHALWSIGGVIWTVVYELSPIAGRWQYA